MIADDLSADGLVEDGDSSGQLQPRGGDIMSSRPTPGKLSPDFMQALHGIKSMQLFAKGDTLFRHGSVVNGVYLVERGEVRVFLPTSQSQMQLLEVVGPGTALGMTESMTGGTYRVTAEAGDDTMLAFIPREKFVEFLRGHGDFCMQVVRILSEDLHGLYNKFRSISAHPGRPRQRALGEQLN
jgi:CRP-like cAMP-binding protein